MLDLRDVLQLVVDSLDQGPLAQEDLIGDSHQLALHVALQFCHQLDAVHKKPGEEALADVPIVTDQPAEDPLDEGSVPERLTVIDIARGEHKVQKLSPLAADQMQLEAIEPAHRALSPPDKSLEYLVEADALIPVNVKDILYFYFDQRHVYAKSADGDANAVQFTMSELESELDPKMFFRLNRQYVANIGSITRISIFFNSRLRVRLKGCDQPLTLSKEKSAELREWLDR